MPRIPEYNQRAGLNIQNPTGFQNASDARAPYEAVADFGAQLSKTAVAMDSFFKEQRKATRAADAETIAIDAGLKSLDVRAQIRSRPPEERLKAYAEEMDKAMTPQIESITDSETKAKAANEYGKVKLANLNSLFNESAKDSIDLGKMKNQETHSKYLEYVRQDPKSAQLMIAQSDTLIDESSAIYDPVEKEALKMQSRSDIVEAAVNSHMNSGRFETAKKTLTELAPYASSKQLLNLDEEINNKKMSYDNRLEIETQREEKRYSNALEEQRVSKSMDYNMKMIRAQSATERSAILEQANQDPLLSPNDIDGLQIRADRRISVEQSGFAADMATQIMDAKGEDLKRLGESVKTAHKSGLISDDDYERMYKTWSHKLNEKNKTGPRARKIYQDPEFKRQDSLAKDQLDIALPKLKGDLAALFPEAGQIRVDARNIYEDLVAKGARPRDAMERAVQAVSPNPSSIPDITGAEGVDQATEAGVDVAIRMAKSRYENGAKSAERTKYYQEQLMRAAKKKKAIRAQGAIMQMRMTAPNPTKGGSTSVE